MLWDTETDWGTAFMSVVTVADNIGQSCCYYCGGEGHTTKRWRGMGLNPVS